MKNRTRAGIIALSAPAIYYLIKKRGGGTKITSAIRRGTLVARNAEVVRLGACRSDLCICIGPQSFFFG